MVVALVANIAYLERETVANQAGIAGTALSAGQQLESRASTKRAYHRETHSVRPLNFEINTSDTINKAL